MTAAAAAVTAAAGTLLALEALVRWQRTTWAARDITFRLDPVGGLLARLLVAAAGGTAVYGFGQGPQAAVASAAAVWLAVLASDTDLGSRKIPREATWAVYATGLGAAALGGAGPAGWWSVGIAFLIAYLPMTLASRLGRGGMGYADVRLILAFVLSFAWWAGSSPLILGLVLGCAIQLVFGHLLVRLVKGRPAAPAPEGALPADATASGPRRKARRLLPFGPALAVGTLAAVALALTGDQSACSDLAGIADCR